MINKLYPLLVVVFLFLTFSCSQKRRGEAAEEDGVELADTFSCTMMYGICIDSLNVNEQQIRPGDNMGAIFSRLGIPARKGDSLIRSCSDILDPKRLRAGMSYSVFTTADSLARIRYIAFAKSQTCFAVIDMSRDSLCAYEYNKPIRIERRYVEGRISSSLWNELQANGVSPLLAMKIADVYAWQIDFYDVKENDSFQVLFDMTFIDDTTALGVSTIQGAQFTHKGKQFTAIPFTQDSVFEYFDEEGNSLRRAFLKAPLDFFRITSRFSNARFHPVLKRYRAHHGVDYAAPVGTPVKSIGAGTVVERGFQGGGAGNYVKVKHNSVYSTTYMHLSRFAKGLQKGSRVQQGEVIGYVGSTGLSTGPHLDFRVYKNGQPINPLEMEAPPSLPVKAELVDSFMQTKQVVLAEIDSFHRIHASKSVPLVE